MSPHSHQLQTSRSLIQGVQQDLRFNRFSNDHVLLPGDKGSSWGRNGSNMKRDWDRGWVSEGGSRTEQELAIEKSFGPTRKAGCSF